MEKITYKNKVRNVLFLSAGCSLLMAREASPVCNMDVLHRSLGINRYKIFHLKTINLFFNCKLLKFIVIKSLDPDPH